MLGSWRARGRGGEALLDFPQAAWLVQYRKGKAVRLQTFTDRKEALEAAGLSVPAMSQENVELVRRGIESVEAFWALLDEDVVWDLGRDPPPDIHGVYVGRDSVIEASRRYWGTWE